ncbi:MAG TPA: PAS domain-containing protein [Bryobacteraceae bacterium]|nr:PAS domain-containing protein [Bryobacteraceae bacterium]
MDLAHLLRTNPLMALAFLVCLCTVLFCILLTRRQRNRLDRGLTALVGFIAVYQAVRVLRDSGFAPLSRFQTFEGWVDLASAFLYLAAAFILKTSSTDRAATKVHLRLAEADEKKMEVASAAIAAVPESVLLDAPPLAILAVDAHGLVTHWNTSAESLFGWSRHEVLGRQLPFDPAGALQSKSGAFIEAAVWTADVRTPHGAPGGTVIVAAGQNTLRKAGLEFTGMANPAAL